MITYGCGSIGSRVKRLNRMSPIRHGRIEIDWRPPGTATMTDTSPATLTPQPPSVWTAPVAAPSVAPLPTPPGSASQLPPADPLDLRSPALYLNRELSWLEFNARVLAECDSETVPLLE